MKTTILFITLFLLIISNGILFSQPQKRLRESTIKEEINQYFQNYYSGMYQVRDIVDIDSMRGDKKYLYASIQNPYGMLTNSFVFSTKESDDYQGEVEGNRVGIYTDGNMTWLSEPDLPLELISIFAIDDINLNGTVEIITQSGSGTVYLNIHSWNGTTGNLISGEGIIGAEFAMGFVDVEGDGILEIINLRYYDGSQVWSWNGSGYGQWSNTPIAPLTQLYPANNFVPNIKCIVNKQGDSLTYHYTVENDAQSKQRIELFWIVADVNEEDLIKETPPYWESSGYSDNLEGWQTQVLNNGYLIWPGESKEGFKFITQGLPVISPFAMQANNMLPDYDSLTQQEAIEIMLTDLSENMVWGETIGPKDPPDPFIQSDFLDTLLSYTTQSYTLDWIADQTTADKYDSLFTYAKTLLQQNHIPWVDTTLNNVLEELDDDSSSNVTSEAYALLRYNTEYLLDNLPEVIAPVLNSLSPSLALPVHPLDHNGMVTTTATGELFTDSSVVYFNEEPKTTFYVSDSVLTYQFEVYDVPGTAGDYPVWVSNYSANSDTLYFSVVDTLPQSVTPILNCVRDNGDKTFTAYFGYDNGNNVPVLLPLGIKNYFQHLLIADRGQPIIFLPGVYSYVFSVDFNGDDLTWYLNGNSVTANKKSTPCPWEN